MAAKQITASLRCFWDGKRVKTHTLTRGQAAVFRIACRHMSRYLTKEYKLGRFRKGKNHG